MKKKQLWVNAFIKSIYPGNLFRVIKLSALLFISFTFIFSASVYSQEKVSGKVTDASTGDPLPGVYARIEATNTGTITDEEGKYTVEVPSVDVSLQFSYIGYETQNIPVAGKTVIDVQMALELAALREIVVIGYGTQKKESLTSAITSINSEDVVSTKQTDVVTSLQGKIPGLLIRQSGGTPGKFYSNISMRGYGTPMVVIDGIVRSEAYTNNTGYGASTDLALAQLNPEDIESISVLKDASASIYGLGAGNGVILITTKKGKSAKPKINYSNTFSYGSPKMPKEMGMVDLMTVANEMADNARYPHPYTDTEIEEYRNGTKQGFSWWDTMLKDFSSSQSHNLSIRGGTDRVQYFVSGGYANDKSIYDVKDNFYYKRYTMRGNFTAKLTDYLTLDYQTSLRTTKSANPYNTDAFTDNSSQLFNYIAYSDRRVGPTTLASPNHYTYQGDYPTFNPMAMADHDLNFTDKRGRLLTNNIVMKYEAPFLKGLTMQLTGAYDYNYNGTYNKETKYPLYDYYTDVRVGTGGSRNYYGESIIEYERYIGRFQANYEWTKKNHHVSAMGVAEATKTNTRNLAASREFGELYTHNTVSSGTPALSVSTGTRYETATAGYLGRLNYDYAGKYLVEFMGRYDGTYIYSEGNRWGFFPSYSIGWRVSEESFIKNNFKWINNLKLRWSDGKTGSTQGDAYAYLSGYTSTGAGSYVFDAGTGTQGYVNNQITNTILSWADIRLRDFGVDWDFFGGLFGGSYDIFTRKTTGIAGTSSGSTPTILGVTVPQINIDSRLDVGMDISITHRNKIGNFSYHVTATGTYARSKNLHVESQATSVWPSQTAYYGGTGLFAGGSSQDRWTNYRALWYYQLAGGQFTSYDDINSSNVKYDASYGMQTTMPGQYLIKDANGDGYITGTDIRYKWGESNAPTQFGLNIGGEYKNFDFNMVWQGATNVSKIIWLLHIFGYGGYNDNYEMYLDRYHVANAGDDPFDPNTEWVSGYWPALVDADGPGKWRGGTYDTPTDFTQINARYFRMKSAEIGYTIPGKVLGKIRIESARIYIGGTNLLTLVSKKMKYYDPESAAAMHGSTMPNMRTINFGINVNL
jgi:TonB-linked SusC/RagA family outer membrane protein